MAPIIGILAPYLFKALASPIVAGTAASWIASKFGLSDTTVDAVTNFINGLKPDDQIKLKEMDYEFQKFMAENGIKIDLAQIEVNKAEAQTGSLFLAGWRPYIGWTCGFSFSYIYLLLPFLQFLVFTFGTAEMVVGLAKLPELDLGAMLPVLLGMLGLGYLRTEEKKAGVNHKH